MPGGELVTGAPEDVVVSGGIARAFEGRELRFHGEERSFKWLTAEHGRATVSGAGLHAAMARAVLEREGYAVTAAAGECGALRVDADESGWRVSTEDGEWNGAGFAALAALLRERGQRS
jgi:hypothetical protein